jgi:tRNA A37 methylthiotransferase MiaB
MDRHHSGISTESDEDFEETMKTIRRWSRTALTSQSSGEAGTEASKLKPLSPKKVNERSRELSELVRSLSLDKNREWLGWEGDIVITESWGNCLWMGRNFAYKPVVIESKDNMMGKKLSVGVTRAFCAHLRGEILNF